MRKDHLILVWQRIKTLHALICTAISVNSEDEQVVPIYTLLALVPFGCCFFDGLVVVKSDLHVAHHSAGIVKSIILVWHHRLLQIPMQILKESHKVVHIKAEVDGRRIESHFHIIVYESTNTVRCDDRRVMIF